MKWSRRELLQGMCVAAASSLTGCSTRTGELHLVFHGMLIFDFRKIEKEVWIHMPYVPSSGPGDGTPPDPGHIYCLTRPGDLNTQIPLKGVNTLTGVPSGSAQPDGNQDPVLYRKPGSDYLVNGTKCACRLEVPWPKKISRYRITHRDGGGKVYHNGDQYGLTNTSIPLVYVFEYSECTDARITDNQGAIIWRAPNKALGALNIHAEPTDCNGKGHFFHLTDAFQQPLDVTIPHLCEFVTDALPQGAAGQVGIPDRDFLGLPGDCPRPKCGLGPDPSNCSSMFVSDQ